MAKVKIPKRVGGVKIPKKVRKKAKKALRVAESPVVRELAAAAVGVAAKAKADRLARQSAAGADGAAQAAVRVDGTQLGEAFRAAAIDGLRRFLEGFEEGLRNASAGDGPSAPSKPGRRSSSAG